MPTIRRGANLSELLPTAIAGVVPDPMVERVGALTVVDYRASIGPNLTVHTGALQAAADVLDLDTSQWRLRVPGLTTGLRFRLSVFRAAAPAVPLVGGVGGTFNAEPAPIGWQLDILLGDLEVSFPGLRAASRIPGSGATATHLEPAVPPAPVWFLVSGALQIAARPGTPPQISLIDTPDPLDPAAPNGLVVRMTANPPHFLFGSSQVGLTIDRLVLDLSDVYTPPEIAARNHGEGWRGLYLREATFFFPRDTPVVGALSIGVRELIMGDPLGLQGEAVIEMGQTFGDWSLGGAVLHDQLGSDLLDSSGQPATITGSGTLALSGGAQPIKVAWQVPAATLPDRQFAGIWYQLPDGRKGVLDPGPNPTVSPLFDLPTTGELRYRIRIAPAGAAPALQNPANPDAVPTGQAELAEVRVRFALAQATPPVRLTVDVHWQGAIFPDAAFVCGRASDLDDVALFANRWTSASTSELATTAQWRVDTGGVPAGSRTPGFLYELNALPPGVDRFDVVAEVPDAAPEQPPARRRVRLQVADVDLIVGNVDGPVDQTNQPVPVARVVATELLADFHDEGARRPALASATLDASGHPQVPTGTIAEVELATGSTGGSDGPRGVNLMMVFDQTTVTEVRHTFDTPRHPVEQPPHPVEARGLAYRAGAGVEAPLPGATPTAQLQAWLQNLPPAPNQDRTYFVVARTDDLCTAASKSENDSYNEQLALKRLDAALELLTQAGVMANVCARTEQAPWQGLTAAQQTLLASAPARIRAGCDFALVNPPPPSSPPVRLLPPNTSVGSNPPWFYQHDPATPNDPANPRLDELSPDSGEAKWHNAAVADDRRYPYRGVEIWAAATGVGNDPGGSTTTGSLRVLVPGEDGPVPPPPLSLEATPPVDWRLRLRAKWDSPTVVTGDDAVPVEAEALVAWKKQPVALPGTTKPAQPGGGDFWEVLARFAYDARTGQTEVSGALTLPAGTLTVSSDALAGALALAPALGSLLEPADAVNDPAGYFFTCAAIIAAGAAIGEFINSDSAPGYTPSSVDIRRFELRYQWNGQDQLRASLDYVVDLHVNVQLPGAAQVAGSVKLHYKNVGVSFAWNAAGLQGVGLGYEAVSIEVADMGSWSITGPLGDLIRVATSRFGRGSTWAEFDLEFALDLGVVRLENATIRLTLAPDFGVELRGLKVGVAIENVLDGSGSLQLGDGGSIQAGMAVQIIPAKLGAAGALSIQGDFVAVEFKISLPVGIPLANSGLALYGFLGRFVANGTRNLDGLDGPDVDPAMRELGWFLRPLEGPPPPGKYKPKGGQYAVGLGAIIGTLPDNGFSFNAEGSLCVGFPDLSVIFGIDAKFAAERKVTAEESGGGGGVDMSSRIIGLVVIEPEAVAIAIKADFEIPKLLKLTVPISAYFPCTGDPGWFLRIGTDGCPADGDYPGRPGDPITLRLFPDDLDVKAWAFLMFEGDGLPNLGGKLVAVLGKPIDLGGFAVGMGCGFEVHWEAGPIHVDLSASLLLGLGTKPLLVVGHIQFAGELSIEFISVCAYGYVDARILEDEFEAHVHVCGKVDLLFDTVEECIDFDINPGATDQIPIPPSPFQGVDLCDHLAAVKGRAVQPDGDPPPTVWPDTVAVIHVAHPIVEELPAGPLAVKIAQPATTSWWSGTSELKYAYQLSGVEVVRVDGAVEEPVTGPIDAAWWFPTHRAALITGADAQPSPSAEEGRDLGLFWWHPFPWARWLGPDSEVIPGHPNQTLGTLCEPGPTATRVCGFGRDAEPVAPLRAVIPAVPSDEVLASAFTAAIGIPASVDVEWLVAFLASKGLTLAPGGVTALAPPPLTCCGTEVGAVWALPSARHGAGTFTTLPVAVTPTPALIDPEIYLLACFEGGRDHTTAWLPPADRCEALVGSVADEIVARGVSPGGLRFFGSLEASRDGLVARGTVRVVLPAAVDVASLELSGEGGGQVIATDERGSRLAIVELGTGRQRVELRASGIVALEVSPQIAATFTAICTGLDEAKLAAGAVDPSTAPPSGEWPKVIGHGADGSALMLPVELVGDWRVEGGHPCALLRYRAPGGLWSKFSIAPWTNGRLALVSICGVTETAADTQSDNDQLKDDLVDVFSEGGPGFHLPVTPRPVLLAADATYELRLHWSWQAWTPPFAGALPGTPSANAWSAPVVDRYRFRTAALGVESAPPPGAPPAGPFPEEVFDPRGLARYLLRMSPSHVDAPHFPCDRLGVWWSVDHLPGLLGRYGRELGLRLRRTNPRPAPSGPLVVIPDEPLQVAIEPSPDPWFAVEAQVSALLAALPCIGNPGNFGATVATITAELATRAEYDLLAVVSPLGGGDETVIARSHFRTSRYVDPTALVRGLGLGVGEDFVAAPPDDALLTHAIPSTVAPGDAGFDALLDTIGLDPWPLPDRGRTTLLWRATLGGWYLAGVLLESDEPIHRPRPPLGAIGEGDPGDRLAVIAMTVKVGATTKLTLLERARNVAGTRLLWAVAAPAVLPAGARYTLHVEVDDDGAPLFAHAPLFDRPVVVTQEAE